MTLVVDGRRIGWSVYISLSCLLFVAFLWNIPSLSYEPNHKRCVEMYGPDGTIGQSSTLRYDCYDHEDSILYKAYVRHYLSLIFNVLNGISWFMIANAEKNWISIK